MQIRNIGVIVVAALLAMATAAPAKTNKAAAREAFQRGIEHYNLSEFPQALDAFKEAYRNFSDASFLFNIGQCQRQLGDKASAVLSYKAYLRESPQAPNRAEVQSMIAALESAVHEDERVRERPPQGPLAAPPEPATTAGAPTPALPAAESRAATPQPAAAHDKPIYKRWWLWTIVGVAVAGGVGVGLGVGLTRSTSYPSATTTNGTFAF